MHVRLIVCALATLLSLASCGIFEPVACTANVEWGLRVSPINLLGGAPVTEGLSGSIEEGPYTEELVVSSGNLWGASERAGNYAVTVSASGFEPWMMRNVRVSEGRCHVITTELTAELTPES
jgi:hypothetical protein